MKGVPSSAEKCLRILLSWRDICISFLDNRDVNADYIRHRNTTRLNRDLSVPLSAGFRIETASKDWRKPSSVTNHFLNFVADSPLIRHFCEKSAMKIENLQQRRCRVVRFSLGG